MSTEELQKIIEKTLLTGLAMLTASESTLDLSRPKGKQIILAHSDVEDMLKASAANLATIIMEEVSK